VLSGTSDSDLARTGAFRWAGIGDRHLGVAEKPEWLNQLDPSDQETISVLVPIRACLYARAKDLKRVWWLSLSIPEIADLLQDNPIIGNYLGF